MQPYNPDAAALPRKLARNLNQLRHDNAELYSVYGLSHTDELGVIAPLTVKSADAHYRSGMGLPLLVDTSTLSFGDVDVSDFKGKSTYGDF